MSASIDDVVTLAKTGELRKLFVRSDRTDRRTLSAAEAKRRLMAKAPPMSSVVAKMRLLARKHPPYVPTARG